MELCLKMDKDYKESKRSSRGLLLKTQGLTLLQDWNKANIRTALIPDVAEIVGYFSPFHLSMV